MGTETNSTTATDSNTSIEECGDSNTYLNSPSSEENDIEEENKCLINYERSTVNIEKILKDNCTCPICLELFIEPISLLCGHSICNDCIIPLNRKYNPKCPVCKQKFKLNSFSKNISLQNLLIEIGGNFYNKKKQKY